LRLLDSKITDQTLSFEEARAVAAHLSINFPHVVSALTEHQLHRLVLETPITILPTAVRDSGRALPVELLYERNVSADFATLVLTGKVSIVAGADGFRTDVSSWAFLGQNALLDETYKPDFSAFVSRGPCRCIVIKRARFSAAIDASALERYSGEKRNNGDGPDSSPAAHLSSAFVEQHRDHGKQTKLLTALQVVDELECTESTQQPLTGRPVFHPPVSPIVRRPSLINKTTVPTAASVIEAEKIAAGVEK
jgi:hypothetical protein